MQIAEQTTSAPKGLSLRQFVFAWLFDQNNENNYHKQLDKYVVLLIIANAISLLAEQIPTVHDPYAGFFKAFEYFSLAVFSIEYLLRFYIAPEEPEFRDAASPRLKYILSGYAIIDLAAILPFYLSIFGVIKIDLSMMRALRLLRLAKLFRQVIPAMQEFRDLNRGRTFRQQVYSLLHPTETSGRLQDMLDTFVVWWVFISVVAVVLESVEAIHFVLNVHFIVLDAVAVFIFSMEYIFRLYSCVEDPEFQKGMGRIRYAKTPIVVIDLLAIVPFFLESLLHHLFDLRFLRIFRLMRLLKLTRYTTSTGTLLKALKREWPVIAASTFIMLLLVVLTASLGYLFEHEAQPDKFENIPQSIYWAVVTLASVGYGDISPVTPVGRLMTIIMALVGIGIFAVPAAVLSTAFNDQLHKDREVMHNELMTFLKDGELSEEEHQIILKQAAELHISVEEVELLIERVKLEHEESKRGQLPMDSIAQHPEVAFEQFRTAIGNLRQIMSAGDKSQMQRLFETPGRATDDERAVWRQLYKG
jgi:voltage-gated potassium channel Kch